MSSIFDSVSKLAGEALSGQSGGTSGATPDHPAVASGLLQQLGGTGGLGNLVQTIQQNGGGAIVQDIASGNTSAIDPNQVENLLAGSGLVDGVASKTGLSPDQGKPSRATVLPMLLHNTI